MTKFREYIGIILIIVCCLGFLAYTIEERFETKNTVRQLRKDVDRLKSLIIMFQLGSPGKNGD